MAQIDLFQDIRPIRTSPTVDISVDTEPDIDEKQTRLLLLKILRSGRWFEIGYISPRLEEKYHYRWRQEGPSIFKLLEKLNNDGLIEIARYYWGSEQPNEGNYLGFQYIYKLGRGD